MHVLNPIACDYYYKYIIMIIIKLTATSIIWAATTTRANSGVRSVGYGGVEMVLDPVAMDWSNWIASREARMEPSCMPNYKVPTVTLILIVQCKPARWQSSPTSWYLRNPPWHLWIVRAHARWSGICVRDATTNPSTSYSIIDSK